jgi:hypothetical protein
MKLYAKEIYSRSRLVDVSANIHAMNQKWTYTKPFLIHSIVVRMVEKDEHGRHSRLTASAALSTPGPADGVNFKLTRWRTRT